MMIIAGFLVEAGIRFEAEVIASSSCGPSAKSLNYFIADGSVDSILWLVLRCCSYIHFPKAVLNRWWWVNVLGSSI